MHTIMYRPLALLMVILCLMAPPARSAPARSAPAQSASVAIPDTPAGLLAKKRLAAFNAGDANALRAFRDAHEPNMSVERELAFRQMVGGFELLSVARDEPYRVELIVREQDGDRVGTLDLQVDTKQPTRVSRFGLTPMPIVPAHLMPQRVSESDAWQRVQLKASKLAANDQFSGTLAIGRGGKLRLTQAWGYADRVRRLKHNPQTRYRIGSMYKMFTAVAILQLAEKGRVDLAAPISRYLPNYPNAELARQVSIKQLLTHTGGTGDIFTDAYMSQRLKIREHADYLRLFGDRKLAFVPGTREEYSNYGFVLLGAVIESVTGKSYHEAIGKMIFEPSGMTRTGAEPEERIRNHVAIGYTQSQVVQSTVDRHESSSSAERDRTKPKSSSSAERDRTNPESSSSAERDRTKPKSDKGLIDNKDLLPWRGTAAGGGYSTADDLLRFADTLLKGRLLSSQSLAKATQSQTPSGLYGYGFQVGGSAHTSYFGHAGGAEGMNGALRIYPATGDVVVSLSNMDPPAAETLVEYYGNRMPISVPTTK